MYRDRNFIYIDLFLGCIFTYKMNNIFRKKYNSITTFKDLQNIFFFNPFGFYQLIEHFQGFCFSINFNWKISRTKQNFAPKNPGNFWVQNKKLTVQSDRDLL